MMKKMGLMVLILSLILAGCAVAGGNSTAPVEKQVPPLNSEQIAVSEENNNTDKENSDNDNNPGPTQAGKGQASAPFTEQQEVAERPAINHEGSTSTDQGGEKEIRLWITRDYGQEAILQQAAILEPGSTLMDLMQAKCTLKTKYGGGFIDSINGLKSSAALLSGGREDWFYYVIGIWHDVGGLDYSLNGGETIWWDYHVWQGGSTNSAVIGSYPEPFLNGYQGQVRPTTIMCPADSLEAGSSLEKALKARGVKQIEVMELQEEVLNNPPGPILVLGEWASLEPVDYLDKLNQAYQRNGMGIHFNENSMQIFNSQGKVAMNLEEGAGVIVATGKGLGDSCPLWLVSGTDSSGFTQALELLSNRPEALLGKYGLAINGEETISLPVE